MFPSSQQRGCISVFYSLGSSPLGKWSIHTANGYVKRIFDDDLKSIVLEIMGSNVSTMYMETPKEPKASLGIKLPFLVLLIKNLSKYFSFEVKILDDQRFYRRFRASNFQTSTSVKPFSTAMPMGMSPGWNQIHFNLADFTRRAYGTSYLETVHLQVHANCRIRRIYFTDRLYTEDELPNEFRLNPKPRERKVVKDFKIPSARPPSPSKTERMDKLEATDADDAGLATEGGLGDDNGNITGDEFATVTAEDSRAMGSITKGSPSLAMSVASAPPVAENTEAPTTIDVFNEVTEEVKTKPLEEPIPAESVHTVTTV